MSAMSRLIDDLQLSVQYDFVSGRVDTLVQYLLSSVRKGDSAEVALATHALALVSVTLGAESEKLAADAAPALAEYLRNASKSGAGRAAVATALGLLTFMGSASDQDTRATMGTLVDHLQLATVPAPLAAAAWEAWGLLASTLPTAVLAGEVRDQSMTRLIEFTEHEEIDVKTAAGECIALIWEAKQTIDAEVAEAQGDDEEAEEGDAADELDELPMLPESAVPTVTSTTPADATVDVDPAFALSASTRSPALQARKRPMPKKPSSRATTSSSSSAAVVVDQEADLIARFSDLAKDSGRHQSKKDRALQKRNFREILRTVEDGDVPSESLKIEKSRHEFVGWRHALQLQAMRALLGKGLNTHFVHNETLTEIFDLAIESGDGVDDPARKAASRAQSHAKERANFETRNKNRKKKHALANSFGEEE